MFDENTVVFLLDPCERAAPGLLGVLTRPSGDSWILQGLSPNPRQQLEVSSEETLGLEVGYVPLAWG